MNKINVITCGGRHVSGDDYRSKVIKAISALNASTTFEYSINDSEYYEPVNITITG